MNKGISLTIIILLSATSFSHFLQQDYEWTELLKRPENTPPNLVPPCAEWLFEGIWNATYLEYNSRVYFGTGQNSHLMSINPQLHAPGSQHIETIKDHGRVISTNHSEIQALTDDGRFVYGGTTQNTTLFFFNPSNEEIKTLTASRSELFERKISGVYSPKIYDGSAGKFVFFGANNVSGDNKFYLIRWTITGSAPSCDDPVDLIYLGNGGSHISTIAISYERGEGFSLRPVVLAGASDSKALFKYYIDDEVSTKCNNIGSINTTNIVSTPEYPDLVWLFNNDDRSFKFFVYDFRKNTSPLKITTDRPAGDQFTNFLYKGGKIFTNNYFYNIETGTAYSYPAERRNIRGQSILLNENNWVMSVSGYTGSLPRIDVFVEGMGTYRNTYFAKYPITSDPIFGSGEHTALEAVNKYVYGGLARMEHEYVYSPLSQNKYWIYNRLNSHQADIIYYYKNKLYYGLYPNLQFGVRDIRPIGEPNIINLKNLVRDNYQARIGVIFGIDNIIFIGTTARYYGSHKTAVRIFAYDINFGKIINNNKPIIKVTNSGTLQSIAAIQHPKFEGKYLLYIGANGITDYTWDPKQLKTAEIKTENDQTYPLICSKILFHQDYLYVLYTHNKFFSRWTSTDLVRYHIEDLPFQKSDFKNKIQSSIPVYKSWASGGDFLVSNDGFLYVTTGRNNFPDEVISLLKKVNINESKLSLGDEIYNEILNYSNLDGLIKNISYDKVNQNNFALYVGFYNGRLMKVMHSK